MRKPGAKECRKRAGTARQGGELGGRGVVNPGEAKGTRERAAFASFGVTRSRSRGTQAVLAVLAAAHMPPHNSMLLSPRRLIEATSTGEGIEPWGRHSCLSSISWQTRQTRMSAH